MNAGEKVFRIGPVSSRSQEDTFWSPALLDVATTLLNNHNKIIPAKNLKSQQYLKEINDWTNKMKMKLNVKKPKCRIFNYSRKHQFTTKLSVDEQNLEVVNETKILGTIITDDLKWGENTREIAKKEYKRMQLLNVAAGFTSNIYDLCQKYSRTVGSCLAQQSNCEK